MTVRVSASVVLLVLAAAQPAIAADAGNVIFAKGEVTAERQPPEPLVKGDTVLEDDVVATGDASRAQLLMLDGAKIAIRPNSRLRIDEFVFAAAQPATVTTSDDRSVTTLIKGGFRTITGAIGAEDESAYEVRTPVGVLGIRGTDYSAVFCNADCDWAPGVSPGAPIEDGLYLGVNEGIIFFRNEIADIEIRAGEFAFIPLVARVPTPLAAPPPVLLDDNDLVFDPGADAVVAPPPPDDDDDGLVGFDADRGTRRGPPPAAAATFQAGEADTDPGRATPKQPVLATDPDGMPVDLTAGQAPAPNGNRAIAYSTAPTNDFPLSGVMDNDPSQFMLDFGNNLTGFAGPFPGRAAPDVATFGIGTSANVETGFDSVRVLRWGRWSGGVAEITLSDGTDVSQDLSLQSLHWVSGPESITPPAIPINGFANYSLIGASSPTDNQGNTGVLGAATFQADFTNMIVNSTLVIDINAQTWTAAGTGNIGAAAMLPPHLFSGNYQAVAVGGMTGGTGTFSGFFSEPGPTSDPAFPGGVGLTFSLQDPLGTTFVSGGAVFGDP